MADISPAQSERSVHNEVSGPVTGTVIQAGAIDAVNAHCSSAQAPQDELAKRQAR
jgi:hypothetical protein